MHLTFLNDLPTFLNFIPTFFLKKVGKKTAAVVEKAKNLCLRLKKNKSQLWCISGL